MLLRRYSFKSHTLSDRAFGLVNLSKEVSVADFLRQRLLVCLVGLFG
jgi:hypothetical protein